MYHGRQESVYGVEVYQKIFSDNYTTEFIPFGLLLLRRSDPFWAACSEAKRPPVVFVLNRSLYASVLLLV